MKTKLCLLAAFVLLLALLAHAQWRVRELQQTLDFQGSRMRALAVAQASRDLSQTNASYFLVGLMATRDVEAFRVHFKDYGIRPIATGCKCFEEDLFYWDAYNRTVRKSLLSRYGKDIVQEFDGTWQQVNRTNTGAPLVGPTSAQP